MSSIINKKLGEIKLLDPQSQIANLELVKNALIEATKIIQKGYSKDRSFLSEELLSTVRFLSELKKYRDENVQNFKKITMSIMVFNMNIKKDRNNIPEAKIYLNNILNILKHTIEVNQSLGLFKEERCKNLHHLIKTNQEELENYNDGESLQNVLDIIKLEIPLQEGVEEKDKLAYKNFSIDKEVTETRSAFLKYKSYLEKKVAKIKGEEKPHQNDSTDSLKKKLKSLEEKVYSLTKEVKSLKENEKKTTKLLTAFSSELAKKGIIIDLEGIEQDEEQKHETFGEPPLPGSIEQDEEQKTFGGSPSPGSIEQDEEQKTFGGSPSPGSIEQDEEQKTFGGSPSPKKQETKAKEVFNGRNVRPLHK